MGRVFSIFIIFLLFLMTGCRGPRHVIVPSHEEVKVNYIDSVIYKDSVTYIPKEFYYNVAWPFDSLKLETSQAKAVCWVDSLFLRGFIENKNVVKTKIIEKTEVITNDSIVYVEKPVPYPVEVVKTKNAAWWVWLWSILSSLVNFGLLWVIFREKIISLFVH